MQLPAYANLGRLVWQYAREINSRELRMVAAALPLLVETSWLEQQLVDTDLRVLDCSVTLKLVEGGVRAESDRAAWADGHIPGSGFAAMIGDLSDRTSQLPFMLPTDVQLSEAMSKYGVGDATRVVLYDRPMETG
jgi:thiosulfate/3-mercaptopyruvate sulfurtransferase